MLALGNRKNILIAGITTNKTIDNAFLGNKQNGTHNSDGKRLKITGKSCVMYNELNIHLIYPMWNKPSQRQMLLNCINKYIIITYCG